MIKIKYKGKDITDSISINGCLHDMHTEKRADVLTLTVNDVENLWDEWSPQIGDEIEASYGAIDTGLMYVASCVGLNGLYKLVATPLPPSANDKHSKAWQHVKLQQIASEIANRHGLKFKAYGIENFMYDYVLQNNQTDFSFLAERCSLEGYAITIHDGTLVIYSESYIEAQEPKNTLELSLDANYEYIDESSLGYGCCDVSVGKYHGAYSANNGLKATLKVADGIYVNSDAEATRFAKGLLRAANKNNRHGYVEGDVLTNYAPCSCADLRNTRAPSWDGLICITRVRNDYVRNTSKIFFRKPLEGY